MPVKAEEIIYVAIRQDLALSPGKAAAQAAHAVLALCHQAGGLLPPGPIVVVAAADRAHLRVMERQAEGLAFDLAEVCDAGRTEVPAGTLTAIAFGPLRRDEVFASLADAKLYGAA